jgi:CTP synthase (UTP-ammonia lyase)
MRRRIGGFQIDVRVVTTDTIRDASRVAAAGSAVIVGPGSPYRDPEVAHEVVRKARDRNIPLVGIEGGFQHVLSSTLGT